MKPDTIVVEADCTIYSGNTGLQKQLTERYWGEDIEVNWRLAKETVQFWESYVAILRTSLQLLGVKARKSQKHLLESLRSTISRNENSALRSRIPLAAKLHDSRHLFRSAVQRQHPPGLHSLLLQRHCCPFVGQHSVAQHSQTAARSKLYPFWDLPDSALGSSDDR